MHLTLISDTHGFHKALKLKGGDMLIHAGDVSKRGEEYEILAFLDWFGRQDYTHKIFIAGNHDFFFEECREEDIMDLIPSGVTYLNDSGVEIEGLKIWGSPITPTFFNWAFNRDRGQDIAAHWKKIPKDTDILITHGPPFGILDCTIQQMRVGCEDLLKSVEKIKPKLHVFGHIHEDFGLKEKGKTTFVNASCVDINYEIRDEMYCEIEI
jgi:Icc-related predicted phosphoesterase